MNTSKNLLHYESIEEVPKEFLCFLCGEICSNQVQNFFKYLKPQENNCGRLTNFPGTFSFTSYYHNQITFKCKYCFKNLKAHQYFKHNIKCFEIFTLSPNFMNFFQLILQQQLKYNFQCNICQNLCQNPKQVDEILICLVCCNQRKLKYEQISKEKKLLFQNQKVQCIKCQRTIYLEKSFKHFKKCVFPDQTEYQSFIKLDQIQRLNKFKQLSKIKMAKPRKIHDNQVERINYSNQLILQTHEADQRYKQLMKLKKQKQLLLDEQD